MPGEAGFFFLSYCFIRIFPWKMKIGEGAGILQEFKKFLRFWGQPTLESNPGLCVLTGG
jgi:hypothetical protein